MITVEHVTKRFRDQTVLNDVSCSFENGKIHGIVGSNGSGKTVFMKCICGFLFPDSGKVLIDGKQVGKAFDFPPSLGLIIESPGFLPTRSGMSNLKLLAAIRHKVKKEDLIRAMEQVGLDPALKKPVGKYSLGMRQRLGLAQAIMEDPKLLILDEPFNGLDRTGATEIRSLLLQLKSEGKTILLSSHNHVDIDTLCDTVLELDAGKIQSRVSQRSTAEKHSKTQP
ncbi:MAG: ATP-binding cassette domain-containing protein [Oscillospiraceae bacterium]|nr:ATP-binding cassette domain-containing protein [Oscillospiraceae bacterium]